MLAIAWQGTFANTPKCFSLTLWTTILPCNAYEKRVFQADSLKIPDLVDALLPLFAWDAHVESPLFVMRADAAQRAFCIL